jgi:uncharacterized membrane protein
MMIESAWAYVAVLLVCAGLFPMLESQRQWRIFNILPPIVLTYLLVTALSVSGLWQVNDAITDSRKMMLSWILPALMFLLLVNCDIKAILALGPRILAAFLCATGSILLAMFTVYAVMQGVLPASADDTLASVAGGWIGGTANMIAVSQALAASPDAVANALLTDALCYSVWVLLLFSSVPLQGRVNQWLGVTALADRMTAHVVPAKTRSLDTGTILLWLGLGLLVGKAANSAAAFLPESAVLSQSSWTMLLATLFGLLASLTPLRHIAGSMTVSSALLAVVVAALASGASFSGLSTAPLFILSGFMVLALHGTLMLLAAKLFRFDLALCGIASLANVGGVASAPLLAAAYAPVLAPLGVLLAMLGYVLGTGGGLALASAFQWLGAP